MKISKSLMESFIKVIRDERTIHEKMVGIEYVREGDWHILKGKLSTTRIHNSRLLEVKDDYLAKQINAITSVGLWHNTDALYRSYGLD